MRILKKKETVEMSVNDPMKEYQERLYSGLKAGKLKIDDIERLMGEAIEQFKDNIATKTTEIVEQVTPATDTKDCPDCGRGLKKTKS